MQRTISKDGAFEAAHFIPNHPGKCRNLHGHSYRIRVEITGEVDPETGMILDFAYLKEAMAWVIDGWDHAFLTHWVPGTITRLFEVDDYVANEIIKLTGLSQIKTVELGVLTTAENLSLVAGRCIGSFLLGRYPKVLWSEIDITLWETANSFASTRLFRTDVGPQGEITYPVKAEQLVTSAPAVGIGTGTGKAGYYCACHQ